MSWGHAALDLEPDADARAVKRAYAKRLRTTRPDDDPDAFQQLHEAYQAALAWLHLGGQHRSIDETGHDVERPHTSFEAPSVDPGDQPADMPFPAAPAVDVGGFALRLLDAACMTPPAPFEQWLQQRPELWSLRDKPLIGRALLELLFNHGVPVPAPNFDLLVACFRWDEVGSGVDPFAADQCRLHSHRLWVLQPGNEENLTGFLNRPEAPVVIADVSARLARLTRPWDRLQTLWDAVLPRRIAGIRDMLFMLGIQDVAGAPPPLQPAQVAFWLALTQRTFNWPQFQVGAMRSALVALVALVGVLFLGFLQEIYSTTGMENSARLKVDLTLAAPYVALAVFVGGSLLLPFCAALEWQVSAEYPQRRFRLLRLLLIPSLALIALLVIHVAGARMPGSFLAWVVLGLAVVRLFVRADVDLGSNLWLLLLCVPIVKFGAGLVQYGEIAVFGALLVWTIDAVGQLPHKPRPRRR